jgi:hypothetical protein
MPRPDPMSGSTVRIFMVGEIDSTTAGRLCEELLDVQSARQPVTSGN